MSGFWLHGTILVCGLALCGCEQYLEVRASLPDAVLTVRDPSGHAGPQTGTTPLEATIDYGQSDHYDVEGDPPAARIDQYNSATVTLTKADYDKLPGADATHKTLDLTLSARTYAQVRAVAPFLDPVRGWVGEVREERAFREISEQGGDVPTRIADFGRDFCITGMSISPDGQRIVYSVTTFDLSQLPDLRTVRLDQDLFVPITGANIYGLRIGDSGIEHITDENFLDLFPSFTWDGGHLLFCSNRRRTFSNDILRTGADGRGGVTDIYLDQRSARAIKPTQAIDGTITFAVYPEGWNKPGDVQIYTVGGPNQFPTQIALGTEPAISPNGRQIAYIGADGNLWVVNVDGSNNTQLTTGADDILHRFKSSLSGPEQAAELAQYNYIEAQGHGSLLLYYQPYSFPCWSAGGKRIIYSSKEGTDPTGRPHDDIWIMGSTGENKQQLTTNGSQNRFPVMSPDQRFIYFYSNRGLTWAIWRIPAPQPIDPAIEVQH
jgi:WD40 repeat protein